MLQTVTDRTLTRGRRAFVIAMALTSLGALSVASPTMAHAESLQQLFKPFLAQCPLRQTEPQKLTQCIWGESSEGSEFVAGKIAVPLNKHIFLQGGSDFNEVTEHFTYVNTENGNNVVSKVAQPVTGGLTAIVDPSKLSEKELARYNKVVESGKTGVTATIELAGPASSVTLSEEALLLGEGTALGLPVEVKLSNSFLGGSCYVGTNNNPVVVDMTTGSMPPNGEEPEVKGTTGELEVKDGGVEVNIFNNQLVNNTYAAPGATGCGVRSGADEAVNSASGLPSPTGHNRVVLHGTLKVAGAESMAEELGLEYG
ncbi:MAG TPA: hypothetical protein VKG38_04320 [Solirubrobacteraceae bacterium]|nr:hypothetical protein [Solirubrobacteraceae bacterium]